MQHKKITGFNNHRVLGKDPHNALEIALVEELNKQLNYDTKECMIEQLCHQELSDRDKRIFMTAIQWMGTNSGSSLYQQALETSKKYNK